MMYLYIFYLENGGKAFSIPLVEKQDTVISGFLPAV